MIKSVIFVIFLASFVGIAIFFNQMALTSSSATGIEKMTTSIRTNSSHVMGYYGLAQVSCNSDETLTGGGYYSSEWREMLSVYRNGPSTDGKKWFVEMMQVAPHYYGPAPSFKIYAVCAKVMP